MNANLGNGSSGPLVIRKKPNPILIADPSPAFLEQVWSDPHANSIPPFIVQSAKEAQQILAQFKKPFSGIFINSGMMDLHPISVVRSAHHYQPAVPIYLLSEDLGSISNLTLNEQDLRNLGVQSWVKKPVTYSDMVKLISPAANIFNPDEALKVAETNSDPLETEIEARDTSFFCTRAENFLSGTRSFFDVYVRINDDKYIKILKAGDSFSSDRVLNYIKRGVNYFYLRTEAQEQYINFCDKLVSAIIRAKNIPNAVKISQTAHQGEGTLEFLKCAGISSETLEYANSFVSNVNDLVKQLNLKENEVLKPILNELALYDHGVACAMVSAMILKGLNVEGEKAISTIGLAALLHDIGLHSMSRVIKSENLDEMTESDKKTYFSHPVIGAKILANIPNLDPVIPQIVLQHHERRNRSGFPKQLGASVILQFAEIAGMSDELVRLVQLREKDPTVDPLAQMISLFDGFSLPVIQAFRAIFYKEAA